MILMMKIMIKKMIQIIIYIFYLYLKKINKIVYTILKLIYIFNIMDWNGSASILLINKNKDI